MIEERRKTSRHKTLKGATIVFNNGRASFRCTIRNASDRGARLHVESVLGMPLEFTLVFGDGRSVARMRRQMEKSFDPGC